MRILGIDPGTAITGFGVVDCQDSKSSIVAAGVVRTPAKQELKLRLHTIYRDLEKIIRQHSPQAVAVEQLYFARNVTTAMSVSQARGAVLLLAAEYKLPVAEYTPLQVKQSVTGYGRADKKQMQEMVKTLLGLKTIPRPDDAADALAIAICHGAVISP
jgi:crossover junction endodeoxyribonuclease RuvC